MAKRIKKKNKRIQLTSHEKEIFKNVVRFVLGLALSGLVLGVVLVAPNLLQITELFLEKNPKYSTRYSPKEVEKVVKKVFKDRFVKFIEKNDRQHLEITNKGKRQLIEFDIDTIEIKKQELDGKWRLVIFDIPEKFRLARDVLRDKLKEIGFVKVQKSVWATPYECQDEIDFIASVYEIQKYVNYCVVEKSDFSYSLRSYFKV